MLVDPLIAIAMITAEASRTPAHRGFESKEAKNKNALPLLLSGVTEHT